MNTDTSAPFEANWSGVSLISNTTYDLQIIVEDTAGNSVAFAGVSFAYDITAPDQPVITNPASAVTVNSDNYSIEGTAEAGAAGPSSRSWPPACLGPSPRAARSPGRPSTRVPAHGRVRGPTAIRS